MNKLFKNDIMKQLSLKSIGWLLLLAMATIAVSCVGGEEEQVRQFAADFALKVSKNQKDSVVLVYPDAAMADSLALTFNADSIVVTPAENDKQSYKVSLGSADFIVKKAEDGKMTVTESHGLFAWPAADMNLARKTGQWEPGLADVQLVARMSDKDFRPWLLDQFVKNMAKNLKVVGGLKVIKDIEFMMEEGTIGASVVNTLPYDVDGSDYEVVFRCVYMGMMIEEHSNVNEPGKDVPAGGTVTVSTSFTGHFIPESAYVNAKISHEKLFEKYFKATGNEYKEYVAGKK